MLGHPRFPLFGELCRGANFQNSRNTLVSEKTPGAAEKERMSPMSLGFGSGGEEDATPSLPKLKPQKKDKKNKNNK